MAAFENITIRPLQPQDLKAVVALHQNAMDNPWTLAQWQSVFAPRYRSYVCEVQQLVVAVAVLHCVLDELELQTLAVHASCRRQGLAKALIQYAGQDCKEACKLLLEVDAANTPAVSLYQQDGFEITATRKNYYRHSNGNGDALLMTKILNRDDV